MVEKIDKNIDLSSWMGTLPEKIAKGPLMKLKIPGSHDSFTYSLDRNIRIANDVGECIRMLDCPATRSIVYNWTVCQEKTATEQLNLGVRYFDIRISHPDDAQPGDFRIVHGLYGEEISSVIVEILEFLGEHPKEVVFLDFNHFFNFNKACHNLLTEIILSLFDSLLCPPTMDLLSLDDLWKKKFQVIVFYQPGNDSIPIPSQFWGPKTIVSPWPDTDDPKSMIALVEKALSDRKPSDTRFFVTQGILTPRMGDILKHACRTLREDLSVPATREVVAWLKGFKSRELLNIVMCDFVELFSLTELIVSMNY